MHKAKLAERVASATLIVAPWLVLAWSPPTLFASLCRALVIAAIACHGFGAAFAIVLDRGTSGLLFASRAHVRRSVLDAMCLGIAIITILGGTLAAFHHFDLRAQLGVLITGLALHVLAVVHHHRNSDLVGRCRAALAQADVGLVLLWLVALGIVVVHLIGLLASQHAPVWDDDGNWYAAVARLRETGTSHDPIGYSRAYQLGGSVATSALGATVAFVSCTRVAEALSFALTFALLAQLAGPARDRRGAAGLLLLLCLLAASAKSQAEIDASLFWLPTALFVAVFRQLLARRCVPEQRGGGAWLVLLFAGLCAIRLEYAAFALALFAIDAPPVSLRARALYAARLTGGVALCLAPMWVEWRHAARIDGPPTFAWLAPLLASVVVGTIATLLPRGPRTPFVVLLGAVAVGAALMTVVRSPSTFGLRVLSVPIFSLLYLGVVTLARTQWAAPTRSADPQPGRQRGRYEFTTAVILVGGLLAFIQRAQDPTLRFSWRERWRSWVEHGSELAVASATPVVHDPYSPLLARVPAGAVVLVWVAHPERIDFARHLVRDLRVPNHHDLRTYNATAPSPAFARLVRATGAQFLLFEPDMEYRRREQDFAPYGAWCTPANPFADPVLGMPPVCADPIERALVDHPIVASDGVVLVDLARDR